MPSADLAIDATAAAGITLILVQLLNDLWVSTSKLSSTQRAALLRGVSYLLNLGLLVLAVATVGAFRTSDLFMYIALAFGQAIGSHVGYTLVGKSGQLSGGGGQHVTAPPTVDAPVPEA